MAFYTPIDKTSTVRQDVLPYLIPQGFLCGGKIPLESDVMYPSELCGVRAVMRKNEIIIFVHP
jgi:hypothetical protein